MNMTYHMYDFNVLFTVIVICANLALSIYAMTQWGNPVELILFAIGEFLSVVVLVMLTVLVHGGNGVRFVICLVPFLISVCAGTVWIHRQLILKVMQDQLQLKINISICYLFILSQLSRGYILHNMRFRRKREHQDSQETGRYWHSRESTLKVNNKDSLQTLVSQNNSSMLNVFKVTETNQLRTTSNESISHTQDKNLYTHYPLNNDQELLKEKYIISQLSNSLLPPHLQKGESDIIMHRKQSADLHSELANIPQIPRQNFQWQDQYNGKRFISLNEWEQNKQDWLNVNVVDDNDAPSLHSFRNGLKTPPMTSEPHTSNDSSFDMLESPMTRHHLHLQQSQLELDEDVLSIVSDTAFNSFERPSRSHSPVKNKSKPASPIKKFFAHHHNNSLQDQQYLQHSKSMFDLQLQHPRKRASFLNLSPRHSLSISTLTSTTATINTLIPPPPPQQHVPRRSKSLSPIKKAKFNPVAPLTKTPIVKKVEDEYNLSTDDSTQEYSQLSSNSPTPSVGFGEYDREKWRRIKLRLQEQNEV